MKKIKLINAKFPMVDFDNLKKSDKKTVAIVNKLVKEGKAGVKQVITASGYTYKVPANNQYEMLDDGVKWRFLNANVLFASFLQMIMCFFVLSSYVVSI